MPGGRPLTRRAFTKCLDGVLSIQQLPVQAINLTVLVLEPAQLQQRLKFWHFLLKHLAVGLQTVTNDILEHDIHLLQMHRRVCHTELDGSHGELVGYSP